MLRELRVRAPAHLARGIEDHRGAPVFPGRSPAVTLHLVPPGLVSTGYADRSPFKGSPRRRERPPEVCDKSLGPDPPSNLTPSPLPAREGEYGQTKVARVPLSASERAGERLSAVRQRTVSPQICRTPRPVRSRRDLMERSPRLQSRPCRLRNCSSSPARAGGQDHRRRGAGAKGGARRPAHPDRRAGGRPQSDGPLGWAQAGTDPTLLAENLYAVRVNAATLVEAYFKRLLRLRFLAARCCRARPSRP